MESNAERTKGFSRAFGFVGILRILWGGIQDRDRNDGLVFNRRGR